MPLAPGSGICCGYTMTRAILGDAISLVRGDRFYTTDYTRMFFLARFGWCGSLTDVLFVFALCSYLRAFTVPPPCTPMRAQFD